MIDPMPRKDLSLPPMVGEFRPCVMPVPHSNDTEIILVDTLIVWDRWDEKTEVGRDCNGLLVAVRLNGFASHVKEGQGDG